MNAIEVTNISKNYGKVRALDNVSFSVAKGEVFLPHRSRRSGKDVYVPYSLLAIATRWGQRLCGWL